MELRDWLTILALILGPILAVQVSEYLTKLKEKKRRKIELFQKLMSTRATRLSQAHVEALNMIDLTFYGDKPIIDAWRLYFDHLCQTKEDEEWSKQAVELMNSMLLIMSKSVGFDIDPLTIKKVWYSPRAHGDAEHENEAIRKGLAELFKSNMIQIALQKTEESKALPSKPEQKEK